MQFVYANPGPLTLPYIHTDEGSLTYETLNSHIHGIFCSTTKILIVSYGTLGLGRRYEPWTSKHDTKMLGRWCCILQIHETAMSTERHTFWPQTLFTNMPQIWSYCGLFKQLTRIPNACRASLLIHDWWKNSILTSRLRYIHLSIYIHSYNIFIWSIPFTRLLGPASF
jgi:hypothetical protein